MLAKENYDNIFRVDLTQTLIRTTKNIITLFAQYTEHVTNAYRGFKKIFSNMLRRWIYLFESPFCRHAIFARLNLALPQEFKKRSYTFISKQVRRWI